MQREPHVGGFGYARVAKGAAAHAQLYAVCAPFIRRVRLDWASFLALAENQSDWFCRSVAAADGAEKEGRNALCSVSPQAVVVVS